MSLVERDELLDLLSGLLADVMRGQGRTALVGGAAAVGKSALLEAFAAEAAKASARTLVAAASASEQHIPLGVMDQLLQDAPLTAEERVQTDRLLSARSERPTRAPPAPGGSPHHSIPQRSIPICQMKGEIMRELQTFCIPSSITGTHADQLLGKEMLRAWQTDGIFQVSTTPDQDAVTRAAYAASKRFFGLPFAHKAKHVSDLSYAGYIASGEEVTAGEADYSEIFTVTKEVQPADARVHEQWPCHGPVPWPDEEYAQAMRAYMADLGAVGDKLLRLTALGLGLPDIDSLTKLADDGWHHMRVLRFPAETSANAGRGIGAHTDYGMLVIATQDDVGGLWVRSPVEGERRNRNWLPEESAAGVYEDNAEWTYVAPVPNVLTVFPGDIMQFMTGGTLLSTPHKVRLAQRERYAMAYFHEPAFQAVARPLDDPASEEYIHYGTHFTNMFMRCYPERVTTQRIHDEDRLTVLEQLREKALAN